MTEILYPLAHDTIDRSDIDALCEWLKQEPIPRLTKDKLTVEFEKQWAEYIGTKFSVYVNSGSSANLLMLYAAKLMLEKKRASKIKVACPSVGWRARQYLPLFSLKWNQ